MLDTTAGDFGALELVELDVDILGLTGDGIGTLEDTGGDISTLGPTASDNCTLGPKAGVFGPTGDNTGSVWVG